MKKIGKTAAIGLGSATVGISLAFLGEHTYRWYTEHPGVISNITTYSFEPNRDSIVLKNYRNKELSGPIELPFNREKYKK